MLDVQRLDALVQLVVDIVQVFLSLFPERVDLVLDDLHDRVNVLPVALLAPTGLSIEDFEIVRDDDHVVQDLVRDSHADCESVTNWCWYINPRKWPDGIKLLCLLLK